DIGCGKAPEVESRETHQPAEHSVAPSEVCVHRYERDQHRIGSELRRRCVEGCKHERHVANVARPGRTAMRSMSQMCGITQRGSRTTRLLPSAPAAGSRGPPPTPG